MKPDINYGRRVEVAELELSPRQLPEPFGRDDLIEMIKADKERKYGVGKQKAIIVDLDGTLCNADHRKHHVEKKPTNWPAFYEALVHDEPHQWCLDLIDGMRGIAEIVFVSGRPDNYKNETKQWLERHKLEIWPLFMRKEKDFRQDAVIKAEIYREHIEPKYEVLFCVDDRKQVVDMWRSLGLICLQCAEGNF
jgi:predicted secreted acid phosphatase